MEPMARRIIKKTKLEIWVENSIYFGIFIALFYACLITITN